MIVIILLIDLLTESFLGIVAVLQQEDTAKIATAQTVLTIVVMRMQEQDRMQSMLYWNVELQSLCQMLGACHVQCKVLRYGMVYSFTRLLTVISGYLSHSTICII